MTKRQHFIALVQQAIIIKYVTERLSKKPTKRDVGWGWPIAHMELTHAINISAAIPKSLNAHDAASHYLMWILKWGDGAQPGYKPPAWILDNLDVMPAERRAKRRSKR